VEIFIKKKNPDAVWIYAWVEIRIAVIARAARAISTIRTRESASHNPVTCSPARGFKFKYFKLKFLFQCDLRLF
jgi:hypothetical protein